MFLEAKRQQAFLHADEMITIADNEDPEGVNRDRLRIDTRKWVAGKLLSNVYGDKQQVETTIISHEERLKELE